MRSAARLAVGAAFAAVLAPLPVAAAKPGREFAASVRAPFTGDFDAMVARRMVRILVVPNQTAYFVDKGTQRGIAYDGGRAFEEEINRNRKKGTLRIEVVFVPVRRDDLFGALVRGEGDLAAGNLTITPERQDIVDFTLPVFTGVDEIVVTGPASPAIQSLDDLAGKKVFVRPSSSYFQSLGRLNAEFSKRGMPAVAIERAPEELEDEDILEMLNAGLIEVVIVDSHRAGFWTQVLPDIRLHPDIAMRKNGEIAWATRKNSPQLAAVANAVIEKHRIGSAFGNQKFKEYLKSLKYVKRASSEQERRKLLELVAIFRKYADRCDFDWLMMAAQGYQESRLDQSVRCEEPGRGHRHQAGDAGHREGAPGR